MATPFHHVSLSLVYSIYTDQHHELLHWTLFTHHLPFQTFRCVDVDIAAKIRLLYMSLSLLFSHSHRFCCPESVKRIWRVCVRVFAVFLSFFVESLTSLYIHYLFLLRALLSLLFVYTWNLNICGNRFSCFFIYCRCRHRRRCRCCCCCCQPSIVAVHAESLSSSWLFWYIITVQTHNIWSHIWYVSAPHQCPASMDRPLQFHALTGWTWEHSFASVMYFPISIAIVI